MMTKQQLRQSLLAQRNLLTQRDIEEKSLLVQQSLWNLPAYQQAKTVLFFISFNTEINTQSMLKIAVKSKRVLVPKVVDNSTMIPVLITDFNQLTKGKYGILEPTLSSIHAYQEDIDIVLVPAIVFDKQGYRIGYGKGYYDNFLRHTQALYIGLCMDFQIIDHLPYDEWDIPVHSIISEKRIIHIV